MRLALLVVGALALHPPLAHAATSARTAHAAVALYVGSTPKPGATVLLGIDQKIAPGWHTYWRNPGDAGLATSIDWTLPKGISAGAIKWPTPQRIVTSGVVNYGYEGEATLLVPLTIAADATPGPVRAHLSWLACADMCVPEEASVDLDLASATPAPAKLVKAEAALPRSLPGHAALVGAPRSLTLVVRSRLLRGLAPGALQFFPATPNVVDYDVAPRIRLDGDALRMTFARARHASGASQLAGDLEIAGHGAFAVLASMHSGALGHAGAATARHGWAFVAGLIGLAFAGGLILNLMPCVLPILSMKALALAKVGRSSQAARRDGAFYFAGVMAAFAGLGGALIVLKLAGSSAGWGFQLQSPAFVLALAILMVAIGLNLMGAFEVPFGPTEAADALTRHEDWRGAFFTGGLAVLVASPCTAPFMGVALGAAMLQPPLVAESVFLALGIGFALPFAALAFAPPLRRVIPRPGPWMTRFKQVLAFPVFATALWLTWVLVRQVGAQGLLIAGGIGLGAAILVWLLPLLKARLRWAVGLAGLAALGVGASALHSVGTPALRAAQWSRWSARAVGEAQAAGHPVLVDFSAAWCITCLVNERLVLDDPSVNALLSQDGVVRMKADWTDRNPAITGELSRYGRTGVPLYLAYPGRSGGQAIVLPQILTPAELKQTFVAFKAR